MTSLSTGSKTLLKITPCKLEKKPSKISLGNVNDSFEVMLNPSAYSHGFTIKNSENSKNSKNDKTSKKDAIGKSAADNKFNTVGPETIDFELWIDGTGVVSPLNPGSESPDVKTQIQHLKDVVYVYHGEEHSPNPVRLLWGSLIFFGFLDSMSVDYTLFKPSGEPLRAKVKLSFSGYQSKDEESLRANRSSPDLDHVVEVKAGDTLPLLCYRIYKDPAYYTEIARVNNLVNFRSLVPGTRLRFPPLR